MEKQSKSQNRRKSPETLVGEFAAEYGKMVLESFGGGDAVIFRWDEIVGPELAGKVTLESIDERQMTVRCAHPVYQTAYRLREREILSRLRTLFPKYSGIRKARALC